MNILILGFYNHDNLGDDLFIPVFQHILKKHNLYFSDIDNCQINFQPDVIICGGGDIINDYFMPKIRAIVNNYTAPIYAIGVGFPYLNLINEEYLNIFDVILTRTFDAASKITTATPKIFHIPDLVTLLPQLPFLPVSKMKSKSVGFFLARSIYSHEDSYNVILEKFSKVVKFFLDRNYNVYLYPMNSSENPKESDIIINNDIVSSLEEYSNLHVCDYIEQSNVLSLFESLDFVVATRYHAHILAILTKTPFLSISCSKKVEDLMKSCHLEELYIKMETDNFAPVDFDLELTLNKLDNILYTEQTCFGKKNKSFSSIKKHFQLINDYWRSIPMVTIIRNLVESGIKAPYRNSKIMKPIIEKFSFENEKSAAEIISFITTSRIDSNYNWGLEQQVLKPDYNLNESIKWILKEEYKKMNINLLDKKVFNIKHFDFENLESLHRSGWAYVVGALEKHHSSNPNKIIFDLFLDKTFGWKKDFYVKINYLPIKQTWSGILHHTPERNYSNYNLTNVFECELFKSSLQTCKCLIVLSNYIRKWCENKLFELNIKVPVIALKHPTEFVENTFTFNKFLKNRNKKVVQIGAWMRDSYAIYDLSNVKLKKAVLRGKKMENYFPVTDCTGQNSISRSENKNRYYVGLQEAIQRRIESVEVIDYLNNSEYDDLLSQNIVFIKLVDASAVNTLIESIVRNTPIVINRLPAVVEYLGESYPLYYNTLDEASELINSRNMLKKGYNYLKKMKKDDLKIENFVMRILSLL